MTPASVSVTYQKTEKEYADTYGRNVRTIRRWKLKDWPLDDETATRRLIDAGGGGNEPQDAIPFVKGTGAVGLAAALERLREAERDAHASYESAREAGTDETAVGYRQKQWFGAVEALRKAEEANPSVARENQNAVSLDELRHTLTQLFAQLRQDLDTLPRRVALELVGKDEIGIREVLARETGELITNLYACQYLESGAASEG